MQVAQQALWSYRRVLLLRGILAIVLGILALVLSPRITVLVLVYLFGAYAFITGVVSAAMALRYTNEQGWALWSASWPLSGRALPPSLCSS